MCPLYELYCKKCDTKIEKLMSYYVYHSCNHVCENCHNLMDRQLSATSFSLQGKGFYSPSKTEFD